MLNLSKIHQPLGSKHLADNALWECRFEIKSSSSNRVYIIARNKQSKKWGCSCPGFLSNRKCKHLLDGCEIPMSEIHGRDKFEEKKRNRIG
jgi:hypothetical protein